MPERPVRSVARGLLPLAFAALAVVIASGATAARRVAPSFGGCLSPPPSMPISSILPADMSLPDQRDANCFAWQEFVALNWRAAPNACGVPDPSIGPASFGKPNDTLPVVWETFEEASRVFKAHAADPDPWCSSQPLPAAVRDAPGAAALKRTSPRGYKTLVLDSKLAANLPLSLQEFNQAFPNHAWLTAQNGHLTMYEVRLNQDEFNYIKENRLFDARVQQTFARSPGIDLPDGTSRFSSYGKVGTIEVKAAWIQLDDPSLFSSFKTARAIVKYPKDPTPHQVTVGLVGLHIIHKTALAQQFVWATFEHVGLDPTTTQVRNHAFSPPYLYFDPTCNPSIDPHKCHQNTPPKAGEPFDAPMQVARVHPISSNNSDNVAGLNEAMWNLIRSSNPHSVFLNYQLVDVLWPNQSTTIPAASLIPLTQGDPQPNPSLRPVANTSLETYIQKATCLDCHDAAPIAKVVEPAVLRILKPRRRGPASASTTASPPIYASDYSFLFSRAQSSRRSSGFPTLPVALGIGAAVLATAFAVGYRRRWQTK
jgi:hypothetical protein